MEFSLKYFLVFLLIMQASVVFILLYKFLVLTLQGFSVKELSIL